jgi:hypothetical protein
MGTALLDVSAIVNQLIKRGAQRMNFITKIPTRSMKNTTAGIRTVME